MIFSAFKPIKLTAKKKVWRSYLDTFHAVSVMDLISEICKIQGMILSVFKPIKLTVKKNFENS